MGISFGEINNGNLYFRVNASRTANKTGLILIDNGSNGVHYHSRVGLSDLVADNKKNRRRQSLAQDLEG
jgi:hypothetical protein